MEQIDAAYDALQLLRRLLADHGAACVCPDCTTIQEAEIAIETLYAYKLFLFERAGKEFADEAVIFARQFATGSDYLAPTR